MIRVGTVAYLNAAPLTARLDPYRYEVVADVPSRIAKALVDGAVDVALVPVAAVLDAPGLAIVPGVCVGADGPVESVVFAAETPPEAWTELLLDGASRTSVTLARLLLARGPLAARLRPDLAVVDVPPHTAPARIGGTVAGVVIGDPARALPAHLQRWDLAELWRAWTGLPFVFAVWAARQGLPEEARDDLRRAGLEGVAEIPSRYAGADRVYLAERVRHVLDERALMGLRRFAALAHAQGLVATDVVRFLDPAPSRLARPDLDALLAAASEGAGLDLDGARALWTGARLSDLGVAADLLRRARHGRRATYRVAGQGADDGGNDVRLTLDSLDADAFLSGLVALRARPPRSVAVDLPLPAGSLVEPGRPSTATWLRAIALARLALPEVAHVGASPATQGLEASQLALSFGADDLGTVGAEASACDGDEAFPTEVAEAERLLRAAGFELVRRDGTFTNLGEALTPARRVRPVEERAAP